MTYCKYSYVLLHEDGPEYERPKAGAAAPFPGIYYCEACGGSTGVERALGNLRAEIERDMKLMGCRSVDQLGRDNLRFR